jgi:hypothetical protein
MNDENVHKRVAPAYVRFSVFEKYLEYVAKNGLPDGVAIKTEVLPDYSESVRQPLLASLRFLGLTTNDNMPTNLLRFLATGNAKEKKEIYSSLLFEKYNFIYNKYGLIAVEPKTLKLEFQKLGIKGSTVQKGISFYQELVKRAGVEMDDSNLARQPQGADSTNGRGQAVSLPSNGAFHHTNGEVKTITVGNAGTLTLAVDLNILDLEGDDRDFVFGLIDQIKQYQNQQSGHPKN